jgi:hypothetical protein
MATGLYVLPEGSVMVAYGHRQIPISCAQYKANGYRPGLEKLTMTNAFTAQSRGSIRRVKVPPTGREGAATKHHLRAPDLAGTSQRSPFYTGVDGSTP